MIKKVLILFVFLGSLCCQNTLMAQDPQFSQYYAAPLYLNPGLVGINQMGRVGLNYRSQWPNLQANFQTTSAYIDYHIEDYYSSIGLLFTSDQEGIAGLKSTTVGLQYAYQLSLNQTWTFRPAVQAAYYLRDLDFDKLTFGDQFDNTGQISPGTSEIFNTGLNARFFDLSFGGILYNPSIWFGTAIHQRDRAQPIYCWWEFSTSKKGVLPWRLSYTFWAKDKYQHKKRLQLHSNIQLSVTGRF